MVGQVLIVGAGPAGMALALCLAHGGVKVRIIDKLKAPARTPRALVVQARTLEHYASIGLAGRAVELGSRLEALTPWINGSPAGRIELGPIGAGLSPFPFVLVLPQDRHEALLAARLAEFGIEVERGSSLVGLAERVGGVETRIARSDGSIEPAAFEYVAGCDGIHSIVRQFTEIDFPGDVYTQKFFVADVEACGGMVGGDLQVALGRNSFLAVFPMLGHGRCRLVGIVPESAQGDFQAEQLARLASDNAPLTITSVQWLSTYQVHCRVAHRFGTSRVFLLGDAAHVHSPAGGQGMNTGIGDAFNLGWKLASVLKGCADPELLDSYDIERRAFAEKLATTTDRAFGMAVNDSAFGRAVRLGVMPRLLPVLARLRRFRRFLFNTVSQIGIDYGASPLSAGRPGPVRPGTRMPWLPALGGYNHSSYDAINWHLEVCGRLHPALRDYAVQHGLRVISLDPEVAQEAALWTDECYLVRPDGHIGLIAQMDDVEAIEDYRCRNGLVWQRSAMPSDFHRSTAKDLVAESVSN